MTYHALVSADIVSDAPDQTARSIVDLLGLPEPRPQAYQEPPGHGFRAVWLRLRPSLRHAPTQIEVIGARPRTDPHDYVEERIAAQGRRPVRTHATVLAGDVEEVISRLRRQGVRYRVTPASEDFEFDRLWVGVTADDPLGYDAESDAGLWLEVVPTLHSGVPVHDPEDSTPAAPVDRVIARRFLVRDAEVAVWTLDRNLGLSPVSVERGPTAIAATYAFDLARSARLEVVQPRTDDDLGSFAGRWGAGPHAIVIGVGDLPAARARLTEAGVAVRPVVRPWSGEGLVVEDAATGNVPFELVEVDAGPGKAF